MATYIPRLISSVIMEAHKYYPCITITGPRQSGKSTLCRHLFPEYQYVSLERIATRVFAARDSQGFIEQLGKHVIIDEVQHVPELLSEIQVRVDEDKSLRYILTGSSNFALLDSVTQSLAGRTAIFTLLPFSIEETRGYSDLTDISATLFRGFYPGVIAEGVSPEIFFNSYYDSYVDRDLRGLLKVANLVNFDKFLHMLALRVGSEFNASAISREIGVTSSTISEWLSILETSYIIFRLPPYFNNPNKSLTKSPKIYFYDTGLLCNLLNISSAWELNNSPARGSVFENLAILELLKRDINAGHRSRLYFYREHSGIEVDAVRRDGNGLHLYEIKSGKTIQQGYSKNMDRLANEIDGVVSKTVIYDGETLGRIAVNICDI